MLQSHQVEELICLVSSLDRETLVKQFDRFPSDFPIDFTPEFLREQPLERLRHIFVALCLHNQRMPEMTQTPAAA
jgi:hypothetical protein